MHVCQWMKMQTSLLFPKRGIQITIIELPCQTAGHRKCISKVQVFAAHYTDTEMSQLPTGNSSSWLQGEQVLLWISSRKGALKESVIVFIVCRYKFVLKCT